MFRRILFVSSLALGLAVFSSVANASTYSSTVLADNPIHYWRLGESSNSDPAADEIATQNAPGTYTGGVSVGAGSLIVTDPGNTAAAFDGTDDWVDIPNRNNINDAGAPWVNKSIELWFSSPDVDPTAGDDPIEMLYEQGGTTRGLNLYVDDGLLYGGAWNASDDDGNTTTPWGNFFISTPIADDTTYHAVLVMAGDNSGMNGRLTLYVNGAQVAEMASGVGQLFGHTGDIGLGAIADNTKTHTGNLGPGDPNQSNYFSGVIDELALYNIALDDVSGENRVDDHFIAGTVPEPDAFLVALMTLIGVCYAACRTRVFG